MGCNNSAIQILRYTTLYIWRSIWHGEMGEILLPKRQLQTLMEKNVNHEIFFC